MLDSATGWVYRLGYGAGQSYRVDFKFSPDHVSVLLVMCSQSCSTVGQVNRLGFLPG